MKAVCKPSRMFVLDMNVNTSITNNRKTTFHIIASNNLSHKSSVFVLFLIRSEDGRGSGQMARTTKAETPQQRVMCRIGERSARGIGGGWRGWGLTHPKALWEILQSQATYGPETETKAGGTAKVPEGPPKATGGQGKSPGVSPHATRAKPLINFRVRTLLGWKHNRGKFNE